MYFSINFPLNGKMQQNLLCEDDLGNSYSYFSHSMGAFFPFGSHPVVYYITLEMHGFSHQFPINKTRRKFPSYGTLHYMENVWVF